MAVVSLNLSEGAHEAYKQIPKGSRSRILSSLIETRDLNKQWRGEGVLESLGYLTVKEALTEQMKIIERQAEVIDKLQTKEVIE